MHGVPEQLLTPLEQWRAGMHGVPEQLLTSASIKVLGGVAKPHCRQMATQGAFAEIVCRHSDPTKKSCQKFGRLNLQMCGIYNTIEFVQVTLYANEHPSFPPFPVLLQVRCQV